MEELQELQEQIRRLVLAVNVIDGVYSKQCKAIGIKENTLTLLYALDDGAAYSQKELSEKWLIPKTTLNTIVKECVAKGYLRLEPAAHNNEKTLRLTKRGRQYAQEVLAPVYQTEQRALAKTLTEFSPEFITALEAFTDTLQKENETFKGKSRHL